VILFCALQLTLVTPYVGYAADAPAKAPSAPSGGPSCNGDGRYVLVQHPSVRADQFLVDTCLGRIWQRVTYTDVEADVWQIMPRTDSEAELLQWQMEQLLKKPSKEGSD
jgi:hypothetical protein